MTRRLLIGLTAVVLLFAACGDDEPSGSSTTTTAPSSSSSASSSGSSSTSPDKTFDITVEGDKVTGGGTLKASTNDLITVRVTADVEDEVHIHGYDLKLNTTPGIPASIRFKANIPGKFEIELEDAHRHLADLEVS